MTESPAKNSEPNDRLEEVLANYLRSVEAGRPLNELTLLDQYPDLADDLRSFFANRQALDRIARPLARQSAFDEPTIGPETASADPNRVRYFGDYELLDEIARGGMGVVYRA